MWGYRGQKMGTRYELFSDGDDLGMRHVWAKIQPRLRFDRAIVCGNLSACHQVLMFDVWSGP